MKPRIILTALLLLFVAYSVGHVVVRAVHRQQAAQRAAAQPPADEPDAAGRVEGAEAETLRRLGHSKDHRPDLPQVEIGLAAQPLAQYCTSTGRVRSSACEPCAFCISSEILLSARRRAAGSPDASAFSRVATPIPAASTWV
jgi:hypothetical protein